MAKKIKASSKNEAKTAVASKRRRKRRGKNTLYYFLALFVCMAAGVILSFTVFFRLDAILVDGNTIYSNNEIIETTQIRIGDNMFRIVEEDVQTFIMGKYPYIRDVSLKRRLPASIQINITMETPFCAVSTENNSVALLNEEGKVLEIGNVEDYPEYCQYEGFIIPDLREMDILPDDLQVKYGIILEIQREIQNSTLADIKIINVTDLNMISLLYQDRLIIEIGGIPELEYKLEFAKHTIDNSIDESFVGVLNVASPPFARLRSQNIYTDELWRFSGAYLEQIMPFIKNSNNIPSEEIPVNNEAVASP